MVSGILKPPHDIQAIQRFETIVDLGPGALLVSVDFAFTVIGTTAGAIDQAFVA